MNDILKKVITVTKVAEEEKRVKISDEKNLTYSIFKLKKDGTITRAYEMWEKMPNKFQQLEVNYTESTGDFKGKEVTYRNIIGFKGSQTMFQPAQKMSEKVSTDKTLRASVADKSVDWDKRDEDIKRGLSYNVASRLITPKPDESVFHIADRVKALADAVYTRIIDQDTVKTIPEPIKDEPEDDFPYPADNEIVPPVRSEQEFEMPPF